MAFNPDLPMDDSPLDAAEMRGQLSGLNDLITDRTTPDDVTELINAGAAGSVGPAVSPLGFTVSNPPTQAEVQAIVDAYNLLLQALRREF